MDGLRSELHMASGSKTGILLLLAGFLVGTPLVSAAASETYTWTFKGEQSGQAVWEGEWHYAMTGSDADKARHSADCLGNCDGEVTQSEMDDYMSIFSLSDGIKPKINGAAIDNDDVMTSNT